MKCENADVQATREREAATRRERAKVYPEYRNSDGLLRGDGRKSWNTNYAQPSTSVLPKRD